MKRTQLAAALLGVIALVFVAVADPPPETDAAWAVGENGRGSFAAAVVQPPGALACSGGGTLFMDVPDITFTWASPAAPANAAAVTEYRWSLTRASVVERTGTSASTSAVIVGAGLAYGTYTFAVVSGSGANWSSVPGPTGTYTKTNNLVTLYQSSSCSSP